MIDSKKRPPVCKQCGKVHLTDKEQSHTERPMCFWCARKYYAKLVEIVGKEVAEIQFGKPSPEEYGRTQAEIAAGEPLSIKEQKQSPLVGASPVTVSNNTEDLSELAQELQGLGIHLPSNLTVIEALGNEGTKLRLEISADINSEWKQQIHTMLDGVLLQIVQLLAFGPKHDGVLEGLQRGNQRGH